MENFLIGLFSDTLSKYIKDFKKEQVNANLLNGKGEITNFELNVPHINETIHSTGLQYISLQSVKVNRLGFNVTSYTNIKRSPIIISIDEIDIEIEEPLHYVPLEVAQSKLAKMKAIVKKAPYGLFDRISDNVTIEINRIRITMHPIGCFKTKRKGVWTPPSITCTFYNLRYVSVDEFGEEGSPDQVWKHDSKAAAGDKHEGGERVKTLYIYKKLSLDVSFGLVLPPSPPSSKKKAATKPPKILTILDKTPILTHMILHRKLRDASLISAQVDMTISSIETEIRHDDIAPIVHAMMGMNYCTYKDRAFVDPLLSIEEEEVRRKEKEKEEENRKLESKESVEVSFSSVPTPSADDDAAGVAGGLNISCHSEATDEQNKSVTEEDDEEEEDDGLDIRTSVKLLNEQLREDELLAEEDDDEDEEDEESSEVTSSVASTPAATPSSTPSSAPRVKKITTTTTVYKSPPPRKQAPQQQHKRKKKREDSVNIGDGTLLIHEKISFSFSIHHCCVRFKYGEDISCHGDDHLQLMFKGLVSELIWPKVTGEKGGYAQLSMSYLSLQERHNNSTRSLVHGGIRQGLEDGTDDFDLDSTSPPPPMNSSSQKKKPPADISGDENFPLFEARCIREDPLGLRHSFPVQAVALKSTMDYLQMETQDSPEKKEKMVVLNELGLNHMEIFVDTDAWGRMCRFLSNEEGGGFDPRWSSGDWSDCLTEDMLVAPNEILRLDDHIQPIPELFLDDNNMLSSDLFNLTARYTMFEIRLPAPVHKDVRSGDIIMSMDEIMFVVSSALPRSFLTGRICGLSEGGKEDKDGLEKALDFPNDPSDICYTSLLGVDMHAGSSGSEVSSKKSTFRIQCNMSGFGVRVEPVVAYCNTMEPQNIVVPTKFNMIASFDGQVPSGGDTMSITLCLSMLINRFDLNIDFDVIASAASTLSYHTQRAVEYYGIVMDLLYPELPPLETTLGEEILEKPTSSFRESNFLLRKRRVLVKKQLARSRKTSGLRVITCFHVPEFQFRLWRQHVPLRSKRKGNEPRTTDLKPLLLLSRVRMHKVELGFESFEKSKEDMTTEPEVSELSFQERRVIGKCYFYDVGVEVCDFDVVLDNHGETISEESRESETDHPGIESEEKEIITEEAKGGETVTDNLEIEGKVDKNIMKESQEDQNGSPEVKSEEMGAKKSQYKIRDGELTELFSVNGVDSTQNGLTARFENQIGEQNCSSCALEINSGGLLKVKMSVLERLITLVIEALLMPVSDCCLDFFPQQPTDGSDGVPATPRTLFPSGSIGALLEGAYASESPEDVQSASVTERSTDKKVPLQPMLDASTSKPGYSLTRVCVRDFAVVIPAYDAMCSGTEKHYFRFLLNEAVLVNGHFDKSLTEVNSAYNLMTTTSGSAKNWDGCFVDKQHGFHHIIETKQSLLLNTNGDALNEEKVLVPAFTVSAYYHPQNMKASFGDCNVTFDDINIWNQFYKSLQKCGTQSSEFLNNIPFVLSSRRPIDQNHTNGSSNIDSEKIKSSVDDPMFNSKEQRISIPANTEKAEIGPLETACNEVSISIRAVQSLFSKVRLSLGSSIQDSRVADSKKQHELDRMHSLVFLKERQRCAALALLSSQTCGWIRMGGTCHMGQRSSTTTTLWRYWVCIRNSLLIIFTSPGNAKPVDVVSLRGARLRSLAGGRKKNEIRRGFALVESSGRYRFFVTENNAEYEMWVRGLSRVISSLSPKPVDHSTRGMAPKNDKNIEDSLSKKETSEQKSSVDVYDTAGSISSQTIPDNFSPEVVSNLVAMGFPETDVISTLKTSNGDQDLAIEYLLNGTPSVVSQSGTKTDEVNMNDNLVENSEQDENLMQLDALSLQKSSQDEESNQAVDRDSSTKYTEKTNVETVSIDVQGDKGQSDQPINEVSSSRSEDAVDLFNATQDVSEKQKQSLASKQSLEDTQVEAINAPFTKAMVQKSFAGADSSHPQKPGQQRGQQLRQKFSTMKATNKSRFGATKSKFSAAMKTVRENVKAIDDKPQHVATGISLREQERNSANSPKRHQTPQSQDISSAQESTNTTKPGIVPHMEENRASNDHSNSSTLKPNTSNANGGDQFTNSEVETAKESHLTQEDSVDDEFGEGENFGEIEIDDYSKDRIQSISPQTTVLTSEVSVVVSSGNKMSLTEDSVDASGEINAPKVSSTPDRRQQIRDKMTKIGTTTKALKQFGNEKFQRHKMNLRSVASGGNIRKGSSHGSESDLKQQGAIKLKYVRLASEPPQIKHDVGLLKTGEEKLSCIAGTWIVSVERSRYVERQEQKNADIDSESTQLPPVRSDNTEQSQRESDRDEKNPIEKSANRVDNGSRKSLIFDIKVTCTGWNGKETSSEKHDIIKSLTDILVLHTVVSEAVSKIHDAERLKDLNSTTSLRSTSNTKLSSFEMVRVTGEMLRGVLMMQGNNANDESVQEYRCQMVQEFLNCVLSCPLPIVACKEVAQFLGICDSEQMIGVIEEEKEVIPTKAFEHTLQSAELGTDILAISAECESQLAKAKNSSLVAQKLASSSSLRTSSISKEMSHGIDHSALPVSTSGTSSISLREALVAVMAERDEAHAKLVATNVLHVHEMEQKNRKIEHLTKKLEMAERLAEGGSGASFFLGQDDIEKTKLQRYEQEMENSIDTELMAVCRQLSSEISARTSAALEIIRLKESQKLEQESELAERKALQDELNLYKEMLKKEQERSREAKRDALEWKQSFDAVISVREDHQKTND